MAEAILPITGTVDDGRMFAHLHTVQKLAGKDSVLHSIEIVGCCSAISTGLIQQINKLLPDAKVVTISQIVTTQIRANTVMKRISLIMLVVILVVGGASIANYMFANVYERRREIGIYMAMGANSTWILKLFLLKALIIGLAGGIIGYILGSVLADDTRPADRRSTSISAADVCALQCGNFNSDRFCGECNTCNQCHKGRSITYHERGLI